VTIPSDGHTVSLADTKEGNKVPSKSIHTSLAGILHYTREHLNQAWIVLATNPLTYQATNKGLALVSRPPQVLDLIAMAHHGGAQHGPIAGREKPDLCERS
jgi:hypothetical protein